MTGMEPRNPYRPGVGIKPLTLAGRDGEIARFEKSLRSAPEIPANLRLTGLRGVGKSVLLVECSDRSRQAGWAVVLAELEPRHNTEMALLETLVPTLRALQERQSRLKAVRKKVGKAVDALGQFELKFQDVSLKFDPKFEASTTDLARQLDDGARSSIQHGHAGLVLLLDEAQVLSDEVGKHGDCPLSMLLAAVSTVQKAGVPLALALCGLPTLTSNLLRARSYSERMFRGEDIGSLSAPDDRKAFEGPLADSPIRAAPDLVDRVLKDVEGYPYFLQLWGAELWDAARSAQLSTMTLPLLRAIQGDILKRLDRDFYTPRIASLRPAEQDLLLAAADCSYPPLRVSDVNRSSNKSTGNVNVLLGRLVASGVIYRVRKGIYEYTAPRFHDFLGRYKRATAKPAVGVGSASTTVATISAAGYTTSKSKTGPH
jgi:hypothetical protein